MVEVVMRFLNQASLLLLALTSIVGCANETPAKFPQASQASDDEERVPLDSTNISLSMRGNEDDYRKCFLRSMPARGAVSMGFLLDENGRVENTNVLWSETPNKGLESCLAQRLGEQNFGSRNSKAEGQWTFVFGLTAPIEDDQRDKLLEEADKNAAAFQLMPESQGRIDAGKLDERVEVRYPLYAHCYRDSIKRRGESRGVLRFRLDINEQGALTDLEDAGSILPDSYAVDCMAEAFYAIDYPKPKGGRVRIEYQLDFE